MVSTKVVAMTTVCTEPVRTTERIFAGLTVATPTVMRRAASAGIAT